MCVVVGFLPECDIFPGISPPQPATAQALNLPPSNQMQELSFNASMLGVALGAHRQGARECSRACRIWGARVRFMALGLVCTSYVSAARWKHNSLRASGCVARHKFRNIEPGLCREPCYVAVFEARFLEGEAARTSACDNAAADRHGKFRCQAAWASVCQPSQARDAVKEKLPLQPSKPYPAYPPKSFAKLGGQPKKSLQLQP